MARIYPVADGVLKHQLYYQPGTSTDGAHNEDEVLTLWTWKVSGSPVGATRIDAEQAAILAWVNANARPILPPTWQFIDLRTWDYGVDPAPRTREVFLPIQGTLNLGGTGTGQLPTRATTGIVALRTQPVGSTVRDRLNGRIAWPILYNLGVGAGLNPLPTLSQIRTAFNALLAALNGAGNVGTWSVVSFVSGGAARVTPLVTPVNHLLVERYGVQRRRDPVPGPYARGA